jgi:hypothetical protein
MSLKRTASGRAVALEILCAMLQTAPASQRKEARRAMLESTRRTIRSTWFFMAILGYSDWPRVAGERTVSQDSPSRSTCQASVKESRPASIPLVDDFHSQAPYIAASYLAGEKETIDAENLPPAIASEIKSIDAACRAIQSGGPIERWRFDSVRARYQAVLKSNSGDPAVKEALRVRQERLEKLEQAAKSAATIEKILAQSHRRDRQVISLKRQLDRSPTEGGRSRTYEAVGLLQPSAQVLDGRKLFVLIGKTGGTVAFLDIPPGLDANPSLARKVGVRGVARYNEDLHSRLITVRNLESIEATR